MLVESHNLATTYYMPLVAAAQLAVGQLTTYRVNASRARGLDAKSANSEAELTGRQLEEIARSAFYYVSIFDRRVRFLADNKGGLYFKDRIGEILASTALHEYLELYPSRVEAIKLRVGEIALAIQPTDSSTSFLKMLDASLGGKASSSPAFKEQYEYFKAWLASDDCERAIRLLEAFHVIVGYEFNRPYQHWYEEPERLGLTDQITELLLDLGTKAQRGRYLAGFQQKVKAYLQKAKGETSNQNQ